MTCAAMDGQASKATGSCLHIASLLAPDRYLNAENQANKAFAFAAKTSSRPLTNAIHFLHLIALLCRPEVHRCNTRDDGRRADAGKPGEDCLEAG